MIADAPDAAMGAECAQLEAIAKPLRSQPEPTRPRFVWFDFWCMPQHSSVDQRQCRRTPLEDKSFKWMLENMSTLYVGCAVLILLDRAYISRFWTQFEAFLSLRIITEAGLGAAPEGERRCVIKCLHNAPESFSEALTSMWAQKTAEQAHEILTKPDVTVTNQKDKDVQLPKLQKLDTFAKSVVADVVRVSEGWACPPLNARA